MLTIIAPFAVHVRTNNTAVASTTVYIVRALLLYTRGLCSRNTMGVACETIMSTVTSPRMGGVI